MSRRKPVQWPKAPASPGFPGWMDRAACAGLPEPAKQVFIRDRPFGVALASARAVCEACPVRAECLAWAMDLEHGREVDRAGIFAGMTPAERAAMHRADREASA